jgi:hypothetical protein
MIPELELRISFVFSDLLFESQSQISFDRVLTMNADRGAADCGPSNHPSFSISQQQESIMSPHEIRRILTKALAVRPAPAKVRPTFEALESRDVPAVYDVGFGQPYASIGAVNLNALSAGDTVRIHWRSDAQGGDYREKVNISGQGTADNPIQILGVPGPNGERPVINGAGATTAANDATAFLGHQTRGLITLSRRSTDQDFNFYKPQYIVIDGLDVKNASPRFTFTNSSGVVTPYAQNAAAIYIERGSNVTIRNTEIHDSGNGFFAGSNDYATSGGDGGMIRDVLFERNYVHDNGTPGGYSEHNIYTEGVNFTFQYNRLGPLTPTSAGANLKDRSAGTIIRYNSIEGGAHLLDLVHAQESASITTKLPSYRQTFVYGNILRDAPGPTGTMIHYGGDDPGNQQDFRKGTLYFYNNTVIVQDNQLGPNGAYQTVIFQLATNDESADVRNNVFYRSAAVGAPAGTTPTILAFAANGENAGQYHMGVNWVSPDWHAWYNDQPPAGGLFEGAANFLSNAANNPGFVNLASYDLHLAANSPLIDKGQPLAAGAADNPVTRQYVAPQNSEPRPFNGFALDLGAFEAGDAAPASPGQVQFSASGYTVNEGAGTMTISVTRIGGSDGAVSVQYATSNGSAVAGQDYVAASGTLTWAAGDASVKVFSVSILNDTLIESNETISFALTNPSGGAVLGSPPSATLTIIDNDVAPANGTLQFAASSYSVNEAAGTVTIGVARVNGSDGAVSVQYASSNGSALAGQDYAAVSGTLAWAAGETSVRTITMPIIDDGLVEAGETVFFALTNPTGGASLGSTARATLTIADNDVVPTASQFQFSAASYSANENAGAVTIKVTRTGGSASAASVQYKTYDRAGDPNVAWGESDYRVTSGKLTFAAGELTRTFTVALIDDKKIEANEVFGIALVNPSGGATMGAMKDATVTILENDSSFDFSQPRFDVSEGVRFATITVRRLGNVSGSATVNYKTQSETAYAGQDFVNTSGQLVFAAGETAKTFTIKIADDALKESTEQLALQLTSPTGGALLGENIWARLFIADDDAAAASALVSLADIEPVTGRRRS